MSKGRRRSRVVAVVGGLSVALLLVAACSSSATKAVPPIAGTSTTAAPAPYVPKPGVTIAGDATTGLCRLPTVISLARVVAAPPTATATTGGCTWKVADGSTVTLTVAAVADAVTKIKPGTDNGIPVSSIGEAGLWDTTSGRRLRVASGGDLLTLTCTGATCTGTVNEYVDVVRLVLGAV